MHIPKKGAFLQQMTKRKAKLQNVKKDSQYRKYCRLQYSIATNINQ